jgi:signal transduction histidine kinase
MFRQVTFPLLLAWVAIFSCRETASNRDEEIRLVNDWFHKQIRFSQVNLDSVGKYARMIDSVAKNLPGEYKAMALVGMGRYHVTHKPDLSMKYFQQALDMLEQSNADSIKARAYNGLGVGYQKKSDFTNALDNYFKALKLFEKSDDIKGISGALANIGEVYQVKGDVSVAKQYIMQSMELSKSAEDFPAYLDAAHTLANIYGMNNQFDSALAIDRKGIRAADSMGSLKMKSAFYNNMGNCYLYSNRPDSARYYFMECLRLDAITGNRHYMVDNYLTLGQLLMKEQQFQEAEDYFKDAIRLSDSIGALQFKMQAWKSLALLYKQQNLLHRSLEAKDSVAAIKDRLINEKSENRIAELKELYEADKKAQTISLQQVKLSRQNILLTGSVVLFSSLLFSGWLMYRRYKTKKEKELASTLLQQRMKATADILEAEDKERRRIAAELHDGVGQVMLAAWINLQSVESASSLPENQKLSFSRAVSMVGEGCKEIREVSHAMMPNILMKKGLKGAVQDLIRNLDRHPVSIQLHMDDAHSMDNVTESILYRVIQEAMNNVLKHADANQMDISIHQSADGITLLIEDDGKGFDTEVLSQPTGMGMQSIKTRIALLNGITEWDSSPGNGTVLTIFIPTK